MNGIHDVGGMDNIGPLVIEDKEPVFHADWERQVFSMNIAMIVAGYFEIDEVRRVTELMPAVDYLGADYYEKWLYSFEELLVEKNALTRAEIAVGKSLGENDTKLPPASKANVEGAMTNPLSVRKVADTAPKFSVGDRVLTKNMNPVHHTRIPRYVRGKRGVIEQYHGAFLLPDTNAYGGTEIVQHNYTVKFSAHEIWGDDSTGNDFFHIDLFDDYMDEDTQITGT